MPDALVLALTIDASIRVWQRVQSGFRDLAGAKLAPTINSGTNPLKGVLDLSELAALDLDEL